MKSDGIPHTLRGRAAREDLGSSDSNAEALWALAPTARWEEDVGGGHSNADALCPLRPCEDFGGVDALRAGVPGAACEVLGDELGTAPPLLYDFTCHEQSPRPSSPIVRQSPRPESRLLRQPLPPLLDTLQSSSMAWGFRKRVKHHTCGGEAPPPPPAVHRGDEGGVLMIGPPPAVHRSKNEVLTIGAKRTPEEKAAEKLGALVGTASPSIGGRDTAVKFNGKKVGNWSKDRYNRGLQKVLSVLRDSSASKGNPISRAQLIEAVRGEIGDTGLREHLLKEIVGMVLEDSAERVCRRHDSNSGLLVYWLEGQHTSTESIQVNEEARHGIFQKLDALERSIEVLSDAIVALRERVGKLDGIEN